jgi:hypothetical protein
MKHPEKSISTEIMKAIGATIIALTIAVQVDDCLSSYSTDLISSETASYILDVLEGNINPNQ